MNTDEKTTEEITEPRDENGVALIGPFGSKLAESEVGMGATTIVCKGLSAHLIDYARANSYKDNEYKLNNGLVRIWYLRLGIIEIRNPVDMDGNLVNIDEKEKIVIDEYDYMIYSEKTVKAFHIDVQNHLYGKISNHTHLTEAETEKLDFTTVSPSK